MAAVLLIFALTLSQVILFSESKPPGGSCDWRYYQHYATKGCTPVVGLDGCPIRFECKPLSLEERQVCHYGGKKYQFKERIESTDPCDHCQCSEQNLVGDAFIDCAVVDCPDWKANNESCYMGHSPDDCCPREICPSDDDVSHNKCNHAGQTYKLGEYITLSNPCKSCICTKDWTGVEGPGCRDNDCNIGRYAIEIRAGCIPVYHEKRCCPISIYCGDVYGSTPVTSTEDKDNLCFHKDKYYKLGSKIEFRSDVHGCIDCSCSVPPDFTCVQKACPPPPRPDCKLTFGYCCPKYECP